MIKNIFLVFILSLKLFASEFDFQIELSKKMLQQISGLFIGELKNAFFLDLDNGLSLNLALDFLEIPGNIEINGQKHKLKDLLTPTCSQPGEIFKADSCSASGVQLAQKGIKLRVKIPFLVEVDKQGSTTLKTLKVPTIAVYYDEDFKEYLKLISQVASYENQLDALYNSDLDFLKVKPKIESLIKQIRSLKLISNRFEARSSFFAIPDANTLRELLKRSDLEAKLSAAIAKSGASAEKIILSDDLKISLKINKLANVFSPYTENLVLTKLFISQHKKDGLPSISYLALEGAIK